MSNGGSSGASLLIFLLPVALIAFMVWSQRRRQRQVQSLQSGLAVGEQVCTTSGLFGTITAVDDQVVTLEVAPGVELRFDRRAIGSRTPTGTPAAPTGTPTDSAAGTPGGTGAGTPTDRTTGSADPTGPTGSGSTSPTDPRTTE
jgi:preprotein translocase subunit YajC